jgi:hypothetical protein
MALTSRRSTDGGGRGLGVEALIVEDRIAPAAHSARLSDP